MPRKQVDSDNEAPAKSDRMINFYEKMPKALLPKVDNPNEHLHKLKLPFRMLIVSFSGGGKTNFLMNMLYLFLQGRGTFATITIVTRNADEPLYNYFKSLNKDIKIVEGLKNTPPLDKMDKTVNNLVVWNDLVLAKDLSMVENYYIRARKLNCSCIFIAQSYYHTPLMIRKNCNYLVLLKLQGEREINAILKEAGHGMTKEQLLQMYEYATNVKFSPLVIDVDEEPSKRFRKGFLEYLDAKGFFKNIPLPAAPTPAHQEEEDTHESGGAIDFAHVKKGAFTAQMKRFKAKHHTDMDSQQFAEHVLDSERGFRATTRRRAQFYLDVLHK